MSCNYKVESIMPENIDIEKIKNIICYKIASLIIYQEEKNCTFERVSEIY